MKKLTLSCFMLLSSYFVLAHPGIGIVKDSKGNIYYTDLKQVWKLSPDGNNTLAVRNVHTHELYVDDKDDLYGEHLWYNGERLDTWGHYVWCLRNTGKLDTIISPREGFLEDYSFVRDRIGNMYWVSRGPISKFSKKTADGNISTIAEGKFKDIRWMHAKEDGTVFFVDLADLYRIDPAGRVQLLAKDLDDKTAAHAPLAYASRKHNVFGIWTDNAENVYTAVLSGQVVKKITPQGKISIIAYSLSPWSPVGGVFDDTGDLWLLEYGPTNDVRVRKISKAELGAEPGPAFHWKNNIAPVARWILVFMVVLFIVRYIRKLKSSNKIKRTLSLILVVLFGAFYSEAQTSKERCIEEIHPQKIRIAP